MTLVHLIGYFFAALAVIGIAYQLIALVAVWRFFASSAQHSGGQAPITLLKPLHGSEPRLVDNLASFLDQDYGGAVQMVCGVGDPGDGALDALTALQKAHPEADIALSTGPRRPAASGKIGNILAMMPQARHHILVLSDSDMAVGPDYLRAVAGALEQPGVGAVTCLYAGRGDAGLWSLISAAIISYSGAPKITMSLFTGAAVPCMGSTIALWRETLEAIGGFERFADVLADDYAIGEAIRATGKTVAMPSLLLTHACPDASLADLWRQHLRWAVTIRGVQPLLHVASGVVYAIPLSLLAMPFLPLPGLALLAASLAVRFAMQCKVDRIAGRNSAPFWLVPVADCIEFAVYAASLAARTIHWRGIELIMTSDGRIADAVNSASELP